LCAKIARSAPQDARASWKAKERAHIRDIADPRWYGVTVRHPDNPTVIGSINGQAGCRRTISFPDSTYNPAVPRPFGVRGGSLFAKNGHMPRNKIYSVSPGDDRTLHPCPWCAEPEAIEYTVRDSPPTQASAEAIRKLASAKTKYTCYPTFSILTCLLCSKLSYKVELTFIGRPGISKQWADQYFWPLTPQPQDTLFTATLLKDISGLPHRWWLSRIKTPKGQLDRHDFGLYRKPKTKDISDEALPLIRIAWPVVTAGRS
jgi:hypothetical protein